MSKNSDNKSCNPNYGCCSPNEGTNKLIEGGIVRRYFIKTMGLASEAFMLSFPAFGKTMPQKSYTIPTDKGLSAEWYKSMYVRGTAEVYTYIGMPIDGMFTGTFYLGGDGKLWLWDIFNELKEGINSTVHESWQGKKNIKATDGANFVFPISPEYLFEQGFGINVKQRKDTWEKSLVFKGFNDITFKGQYPIEEVSYRDNELPVAIYLQSFSPFILLDVEASSYHATIMPFNVTNTSNEKASVELADWLENAVFNNTEKNSVVTLINTISEVSGNMILTCSGQTHAEALKQKRDFGNMSLSLLNASDEVKAEAGTQVTDSLLFPNNDERNASAKHGERLCGSLSETIHLNPKETKEITFSISWYFPNMILRKNNIIKTENIGRYYKKRFQNSQEVALDISAKYEYLYRKTTAWRDTFYENSTLPHWFLNRTFANTSILATETCYLLGDGLFWAREGIGCCPGTCTYVWYYAQAMGRLFPELERNLREKTDFVVIDDLNGGIPFRGGIGKKYAADGQAGIVLRAYRDYQVSTNNEFQKKYRGNIKLILQYSFDLEKEDGEANGTIFGEQHNTLDAEWYGNIPVITSLYLVDLTASVKMAKVMKDTSAEEENTAILNAGKKNIEKLFNGEYFVQNEDPYYSDAIAIGIGLGCYINQVFGQGWAHQVGLGQLYNQEMIDSSLEAQWKYNFVPDVRPLRASLLPKLNGRPYASAGNAGLLICTWPFGGKREDWENHWQLGYFNDCMTGFEYQAASHMIWEDKLDYGLTFIKAIHKRYGAEKRNPYNEIECSDHYSRAMASYGAFKAACGYSYNGPKGQLGFAPKMNPVNFKAAFTSAEGWGSIFQTRRAKSQTNTVKWLTGN